MLGGILRELDLSLELQLLFLKTGVTFACLKVYGFFQLLEIFKGIYKYGLLIFQRCSLNLLKKQQFSVQLSQIKFLNFFNVIWVGFLEVFFAVGAWSKITTSLKLVRFC